MPDISGNATVINVTNKQQMGAALIVQTYANSVLAQPQVNFAGIKGLSSYQTEINDGLATAQEHANYFLKTMEPALILNMSNCENYYVLNDALPTTLPPGSTVDQWTAVLTAMQTQSTAYQVAAAQTVTDLQALRDELATDTQSFATIVQNLNSAVNGDNGVLASISDQLSTIQGEIDGAIAGIVVSSLTVAGGVFVICVGAIATFVTEGTSTGAVIGGVGLVAAGVAGEAGSITALVTLNNSKSALLAEKSELTNEVKLAAAVSSGYSALANQVNNSITAASAMANAWSSVQSDLENLVSDLNNGIQTADEVRSLFVTAANGEIKTVLTDIQTIKQQMDGIQVQVAAPAQTVSNLLTLVAKKAA
ncbi:alpha-helical pore-forming toxin family protein [Caballeronia sp. SEWSISQ10-4 2]|uniref:HBL/NHE enterotoxin family protein n=1 Tax=Caballeronia sp. SEWSISQ10-4 2 TaxID=2937438 RepID=UPI00264CE56C|nr:HBL/NHE enterotoxin family protein [Caballeronia sp. SEWSISQ10-4 2]MDN7184561.1 alpha-helical pore-forming toxin family protein [Caballeronia sp. SEWSISQ10-4 2]